MKKLLAFSGAVLTAIVAVAAVATTSAPTASAAEVARCDVKAVGDRASAFTISGDNATVKFNVTGAEGCKVQLSVNSFYAPTMDGRPYSKQILYNRVTKTFGKGTYSMTGKVPVKGSEAKGCFYQVDLTYGTHNVTPVLAYGHGKLDCSKPTPKPEKVEVCDLTTKKRVMVEKGYDTTRYTTDFSKCEDTPVTVTETPKTPTPTETPEELPETGPVQVAAQLFGAGSMVASAGYYLQSRRRG